MTPEPIEGETCEICDLDAIGQVGDTYFCSLEHEMEYYDGIPDEEDFDE
jgi:hypothetical protein